eukprot:m.186849 g.186849  ORF g.186849 m.186849 type:complete len:715 (-) comp16883_c0_seq1:206-2350(-)
MGVVREGVQRAMNGGTPAPRVGGWLTVSIIALVTAGTGRGEALAGCDDATLGFDSTVESIIVNGSASIENSLGNYFWCVDHGYTICVSDTLDAAAELVAASHAVCVPSPVERAEAYVQCALSDPTAHVSNVSTLATLRRLQQAAIDNGRSFQWHCGDSETTPAHWPVGTWVMIGLMVTLTIVCGVSQAVELRKRRPTLKGDSSEQAPLINDRRASTTYANYPMGAWDGSVGTLRQRILALAGGEEVETISSEQWMELTQWVRGISTSRVRGEPLSLGRKLLKAFCPSDGLSTLFAVVKNPPPLAGLDGLRAFSMLWIILANTTLLVEIVGTDDADSRLHTAESLPQQFTLGSSLAVDTFFFLSGLLTTFTLLRNMRKYRQDTFPALWFILMRLVRLTPLYAFLLFTYAYIVPYVSSGPVWYRMHHDTGLCRSTWWSNLLYANNFYPDTFHSTCMSWTWYLANDMQFFILGLFILKINLKSVRVGVFLCVVIAIAGTVTGWLLLLKHRGSTLDDYYDKPYTRVTPFAIGVLLGILLVDYQFINTKLSNRVSRSLMVMSLVAILGVVYIDYLNFAHHPKSEQGDFDDQQNAAYQAGGRLVFALAICCLTWLCVTGHGGWIKSFLSLSIWEPLGKLTYGAYLIHPIIVRIYYYQKVQLFHFDPLEQTMYFVAITVMTYAIGAVLHITVELPFANLNKILFPHPNARRSARHRRQDSA